MLDQNSWLVSRLSAATTAAQNRRDKRQNFFNQEHRKYKLSLRKENLPKREAAKKQIEHWLGSLNVKVLMRNKE